METTQDSNDDRGRMVPITVEVDDTDLREAMATLEELTGQEIDLSIISELPDELKPYHERERHLLEVCRQSRRMCWDRHGEGPAEEVTIWGHGWRLWLDRAETVETGPTGEPVAAFHIDRGED